MTRRVSCYLTFALDFDYVLNTVNIIHYIGPKRLDFLKRTRSRASAGPWLSDLLGTALYVDIEKNSPLGPDNTGSGFPLFCQSQ